MTTTSKDENTNDFPIHMALTYTNKDGDVIPAVGAFQEDTAERVRELLRAIDWCVNNPLQKLTGYDKVIAAYNELISPTDKKDTESD